MFVISGPAREAESEAGAEQGAFARRNDRSGHGAEVGLTDEATERGEVSLRTHRRIGDVVNSASDQGASGKRKTECCQSAGGSGRACDAPSLAATRRGQPAY